jgi:hypothetical protein
VYQANTLPKSLRESKEDVHGRIKPSCPPFIGSSGLIQPLELLLKNSKNGTGRVAKLELGDEGVCEKVFLGAFPVCVQSIDDDELEVGGIVGGRRSGRMSVRHEGESE